MDSEISSKFFPCIIPVMCCRNVIHFTAILQYLPLITRKFCLMREKSQIKMAAKTHISLAVIRVNDVKMYPSISLDIRFFTANEIACGG